MAEGQQPLAPRPQAPIRSGRSKRTASRGTSEPRASGERAVRRVRSRLWPALCHWSIVSVHASCVNYGLPARFASLPQRP